MSRFVSEHRRWLVALPLLVLLGLGLRGFLATDDPQRRYLTLPGPNSVLFKRHGPIDFAIIGTSRSTNAIDLHVIAAGVKAGPVAVPVVADLSHAWQADGHNYRMLKDLFSRRPVRQAVLYEISREVRGIHYHYFPDFCSAATFGDLLDDFASKPREPRLSRVRDLLELLLRRADWSLTLLLQDKNKNARGRPRVKRLLGEMQTPRAPHNRKDGLAKKRREVEAAYGTWEKMPATRWSLDDINEDRTNYYLRKTIALCRENNVTPVFFHAPGYLEAPLSEDTKREFLEKFGVPLLTPPTDVLARLYDSENFSDVSHMNRRGGRKIYSTWLAGALQDHLQRGTR